MIKWVGHSQFHRPSTTAGPWTLPLTEEAVLEVAFEHGGKHISPAAATRCCNRLLLRQSLPSHYNPRWEAVPWKTPSVLKAPASASNSGVYKLRRTVDIDRLEKYGIDTSQAVMEEHIDGPQFEIDGVKLDGHIHFFGSVRQDWDGDYIERYTHIPGYQEELECLGLSVLDYLEINNSPFCIEARKVGASQWKVIEVNARLGEDPGLCRTISPLASPVSVIERLAEEISSSREYRLQRDYHVL